MTGQTPASNPAGPTNQRVIRAPWLVSLLLSFALLGACGTASAPSWQPPAGNIGPAGGSPDGILVLAPRIVPNSQRVAHAALLSSLQHRAVVLAKTHLPRRPVEVARDSQRWCPESGCTSAAIGLTVVTDGRRCHVLMTITRPTQRRSMVVAWTDSNVSQAHVGLHERPENDLVLGDGIACERLKTEFPRREAAERAIRNAY